MFVNPENLFEVFVRVIKRRSLAAMAEVGDGWHHLQCRKEELNIGITLTSGQSFRQV